MLLPELDDCFLDHIAVAVEDLDSSLDIYRDLGLNFAAEQEVVESQGVKTAFAAIGEKAKLELLCPVGDDGPIHKFLAKNGSGIHHVCFRVKDVRKMTQKLLKLDYKLIYPEPVPGAQNCLVNFIHPRSARGVLIEISTPLKTISEKNDS